MLVAISLSVWVIMVAQCFFYVKAIRNKTGVKPALATWIIFFIGTGLSLVTYVLSKKADFISGIMIVSDVIDVTIVITAILVWGDRSVRFRPYEERYVAGCVAFVGLALLTGHAFSSNLFAQLVIAAGYFPMYIKLYKEKVNTESYRSWSLGLLSGIVGLAPGLIGHDLLAVVYAVRSIVFILLVLLCMAACDAYQKRRLAAE